MPWCSGARGAGSAASGPHFGGTRCGLRAAANRSARTGPPVVACLSAALSFEQYAALNLTVHVTELDVKNGASQGGRNDTAQAETFKSVLSACLSAPNCRNFETWGFEDGHTWLGQGTHPLPYGAGFARKKAGDAIAEMLAKWPRPYEVL